MPGVELAAARLATTAMTLPVMIPLAGGAVALLAAVFHRRGLAWGSALGAVFCGAIAMVAISLAPPPGSSIAGLQPVMQTTVRVVTGGWYETTGIVVVMHPAGRVMGPLVYILALGILVWTVPDRRYSGVFAAIAAITVAAMGGVVIAGDLFNLFVFFEILSLGAVLLMAYERRGAALYAALRYLVVSAVSIAFYLVGLFFLYRATGELALHRIAAVLAEHPGDDSLPVAMALLVGGVVTRIAVVPFHGWLPAAHGEAPTPVSALLSGLILKGALVSLWQIMELASPVAPRISHTLLVLAAASAVAGAAGAALERDAKRLLALSSVSQMGFLALAVALGAREAMVFHAVGHGLFKSLLFLVVGRGADGAKSHDLQTMQRYLRTRGIPWPEALACAVGLAALAGVPAFSGSAGKGLVAEALPSGTLVYHLLRVSSLATMVAAARLGRVFLVPWRRGDLHPASAGVLVVFAVSLAVHGVMAGLPDRSTLLEFAGLVAAAALLLATFRTSGIRRVMDMVEHRRAGMDTVLAGILAGILMLLW